MTHRLAILGDFNPDSHTHKAINESIQHCAEFLESPVQANWIHTDKFNIKDFSGAGYSGLWVAPGSPYKNTAHVIEAIRYVREANIPTLGNCGGFQHMIIEFARNVAGIEKADHEETNPQAENLVISQLSCSLLRKEETLTITNKDSLLFEIIQLTHFPGSYFCSYGINEAFKHKLVSNGCSFTAISDDGYSRAFELKNHPFFMATLFQPALLSVPGHPNPIILAFLNKCIANSLT